jgi:hypothetical protein
MTVMTELNPDRNPPSAMQTSHDLSSMEEWENLTRQVPDATVIFPIRLVSNLVSLCGRVSFLVSVFGCRRRFSDFPHRFRTSRTVFELPPDIDRLQHREPCHNTEILASRVVKGVTRDPDGIRFYVTREQGHTHEVRFEPDKLPTCGCSRKMMLDLPCPDEVGFALA